MNTFEDYGVVKWYKSEKGFGIIENFHDHKEYFIHYSKLSWQLKKSLAEEDIIIFTPDFDGMRNRKCATQVRYIKTIKDIEEAIKLWINKKYIKDDYLVKIFSFYLKNISNENNSLLNVIISYTHKYSDKLLYQLFKKAIILSFDIEKSNQLLELSDKIMFEKLSSHRIVDIIEMTTSPFVCFFITYRKPEYLEIVVNKAIEMAKYPQKLLDELTRFIKSINNQEISTLLEKDKSLITNASFWNEIVGREIISYVNYYVFSSLKIEELKHLLKEGYIYSIDNSILKEKHHDYYNDLKAFSYKECFVDNVDVSFIKDNIDKFSASSLIKIKHKYQLSDEIASELFLHMVRHYLKQRLITYYYNEILLFQPEVQDFQKWITDNHYFLIDNIEDEHQELLIWLYKNNKFQYIDDKFIINFINKFRIEEIITIIEKEQVTSSQKERILSALLKNTIQNDYINTIDNIKKICNHAKVILKEDFSTWIEKLISELKDDSLYILWKECIVDKVDVSVIKDNIDKFSASSLIKIKQKYQLSDKVASDLFLHLVRHYLKKKLNTYYYYEILLFQPEVQDFQKWITDNRYFLIDNIEDEHQELLIWLYKNNKFQYIDDKFIIFYINKFSIEEIITFTEKEQVTSSQKERILSALLKNTIQNDSKNRINNLSIICNHAKTVLKEEYSTWIEKLYPDLQDNDLFILWKEKLSELYPSTYIHNNLFTSKEQGYKEFYILYQNKIIPPEVASSELWSILNENKEITNRPSFYKVLYSIKYLSKIDNISKNTIIQKDNEYYNVILWYLSLSDKFNFETLCRLFIYFSPEDQVHIIKEFFFMAEMKQIKLNVKMLNNITRVDADLFYLITKEHPDIPIDISTEIVIKAITHLYEKENFIAEKDVLNIVIQSGRFNKKNKYKIGDFFNECKGRKTYKWLGYRGKCGNISIYNNTHYCVHVDCDITSFHAIVDAIKQLNGRRYNSTKSCWEVPMEEKERLFEIAKEYGLSIDGTNNAHMNIYKETNERKPARIDYCEGRPALVKDKYIDKDFLWCRNSKCFNDCVEEHNKKNWENYTLLDFCRILGLDTDSVDSDGNKVKYGKYLTFASVINRTNSILEHLYCRECGEMLEPVQISNYHTHLVTHFQCTNSSCEKRYKSIYISKCFNWKCNGVIDERDTKKCPNDWNICPECGSCCSNRVAEQRITNCKEVGIRPNAYFINFLNNRLGHLEKREFYCYKCGGQTKSSDGKTFHCLSCEVKYERKLYDFEPKLIKNSADYLY